MSSQALAAVDEQPRVRDFLTTAANEGRLAQAYLFVGAPGSGQTEMARALAQTIVCPTGGCGCCDECIRVSHHTHPDVHFLSPGSSVGYLAEQVREVIDDVPLTPVRSSSKVYIFDRAELLRGTSANALLKTIEEPPANVHFILIARTTEAVLSTIVSRCQVVPFRIVSPQVASARIAAKCGTTGTSAAVALDVAGTPDFACDYLHSADRMECRRLVVNTLGELAQDDLWDVLSSAKDIVVAAKAPIKGLQDEQAAALEADADYLSSSAMRKVEQRNKRELTARERSGMMEAVSAAQSLLRDVLVRCEDVSQTIVNQDVETIVDRLAARTTTRGALGALAACSKASDDLSHNVTPQLAIEVMLCSIKEALACPTSYR